MLPILKRVGAPALFLSVAVAGAAQAAAPACALPAAATIDPDRFIAGYRMAFCGADQTACAALSENFRILIDKARADARITDAATLAYVMATAWGETNSLKLAPGSEIKGTGNANRKYWTPIKGQTYQGRGWVQLTDLEMYEKAKAKLGVDFVAHPELAMQPDNAYAILYRSLTEGWLETYRGSANASKATTVRIKLDRFVGPGKTDYDRARAVINANCTRKIRGKGCSPPDEEIDPGRFIPAPAYIDRAVEIGGQARRFERLICASLTSA